MTETAIDWQALEDAFEDVPCEVKKHEHPATFYCRSTCQYCDHSRIAGICDEFADFIMEKSKTTSKSSIICAKCKKKTPTRDFYTVLGKIKA